MTVSIHDVREAVAAAVKAATGWQTYAYSPRSVQLPCGFAGPHEADTLDTGGGLDLTLHYWVAVDPTSDSKQRTLDEALVAVANEIDSDPDLGIDDGGVHASFGGWSDYGDLEIGSTRMWAARIAVNVLIAGE